jgi:type I restriction enzyme S subunit
LLCKINPRINRVWLVDPNHGRQQLASTEYLVLRLAQDARESLAKYLVWYLRSPEFREWIKLRVEGATGSHTRAKSPVVLRHEVPVAPTAEQRRIVAAIEEQFSRIDSGVKALQRTRQNLQRMRAAVLQAAVTGRLVPQDPNDEPAERLVRRTQGDRRAPKHRDLAGFDQATLPALRSGWTWCQAWQICDPVTNGDTPARRNMTAGSGDIPFIKIHNLTHSGELDFGTRQTFIDRATHEGELRRSRIVPGDVLINIVGPPLGKVSLVPEAYPEWNTNQAVVVFRPTSAILSRLLALWLLSNEVMERLKATSRATAGQYNISLSACRLLPLPLPPLREQERIVSEVDRLFSSISSLQLTIEADIRRSERLRRAVLAAGFSGRLVAQDPADEPTTALLTHVRDESISPTNRSWQHALRRSRR